MERQLGVIAVCLQRDLCTPVLLQINTDSQQELTEAGATYNNHDGKSISDNYCSWQ